jgi:dipeptidyl aminopeptidase/acylaminoacyl peptidase
LQKAGKPFQLMLYPGLHHDISTLLLVKHWYATLTDFILVNL